MLRDLSCDLSTVSIKFYTKGNILRNVTGVLHGTTSPYCLSMQYVVKLIFIVFLPVFYNQIFKMEVAKSDSPIILFQGFLFRK